MADLLTTTIDKFILTVAPDRLYHPDGLWLMQVAGAETLLRIGLTDFIQKQSGDVAFVAVEPAGAKLRCGDPMLELETIKVTTTLKAPVSGRVRELNPLLEEAPEIVNQDPYGRGWLLALEAEDWEREKTALMTAAQYIAHMEAVAEKELGS